VLALVAAFASGNPTAIIAAIQAFFDAIMGK